MTPEAIGARFTPRSRPLRARLCNAIAGSQVLLNRAAWWGDQSVRAEPGHRAAHHGAAWGRMVVRNTEPGCRWSGISGTGRKEQASPIQRN